MIFLGIAIPIGILLGLLLFFSGLYSRNRLAAAASGGLDMFTTNFENQLDSVENYLLNLSLNDATFRSLSEQTDRTRAYLDAYEIAQGFPAVLAANDTLMGVVLRSGSGNLYVGRYGAAAQQLKQKLNLEAYLGQPGQTNKMMTKGWYLRTIGQRLYLLRSVFYQKASLTAAVDLRLVFEELVEDYGLDGRVIVMNDSGNVLVGDANLLPTKMEWNSEGYCLTKVGRDSRLVVRKQVKTLTVLYLVPYQHFGVDFAPYQILLVMGAIFVLLAIPFLLFYMKQEIFAPMTALVSTNDLNGPDYDRAAMLGRYEEIVQQIRKKLPETKLYLLAYYPVNPTVAEDPGLIECFRWRTNERIREASEGVQALARKYGAEFLDLNKDLYDAAGNLKAEYTIEGMHLYANGYRPVMDALLPLLRKIGEEQGGKQ